jgi:hypothetical protein
MLPIGRLRLSFLARKHSFLHCSRPQGAAAPRCALRCMQICSASASAGGIFELDGNLWQAC